MKYDSVCIHQISYELPEQRVSTRDLEQYLKPLYDRLHLRIGQLESLTGIHERRWWPEGTPVSDGAIKAGRKALDASAIPPEDIEVLIYAGVCRDYYEPATACRVASEIGLSDQAFAYDLSNACLGVLNGMIDIANRIQLGQIKCGMVVSCESSRAINVDTIKQMLRDQNMEQFKLSLATLTGGSGAVAVILTNKAYAPGHALIGGTQRNDLGQHRLCRWGLRSLKDGLFEQFLATDAAAVMKHGVQLGLRTWRSFLEELGWQRDGVDKIISHQVGQSHRQSILTSLGIDPSKDFATFPYLGNMGTVSLPLSAALAAEEGFLRSGDRVGFLGIGSGLNCMMMGVQWA